MFKNVENLDDDCKELLDLLNKSDLNLSEQKINLINKIYHKDKGLHHQLLSILLYRYYDSNTVLGTIDSFVFELLGNSDSPIINDEISKHFPQGIVNLRSEYGIDYLPLQKLLVTKSFQEADTLTHLLLCQLSQIIGNHTRQWLYFTDINRFPCADLHTIDQLWQIHSGGLFGLSVQKRIWLSSGSDWEIFWSKIGWKVDNVNCRYPQGFVWNINAPEGHLPLFNQLRGVQVLAALFEHPAF
uniref:GUN4-like domain-containing protein n=1 Tax=Titanophycus setchellii TaxID=940129 RepID=A0A1G4NXT9_9FLOR|nr:Hypothetical protein ycf53 [Titanophycus setchellii]SCW23513.1 Hypothetical protein ycf53 [Titanophycus setchellii]